MMLSSESPLNITCKAPPSLPNWNRVEEYILYATSCALASSFAKSFDQNQDGDAWQATVAADILRKPGYDGRGKQLFFQTEFLRDTAKLRVRWESLNDLPDYGNASGNGKSAKKGGGSYEWKATGKYSKTSNWDDGEGEVVRTLQEVVEDAGRS